MPTIPSPVLLHGSLSPEQFTWLKCRAGTSSDAEALRKLDTSKGTLRHWKRNPAFQQVLEAIHTDKLLAFRLLALSMLELVVDSMTFLLTSDKGSDRRAGIEAWRSIFRLGAPEAQDEPATVRDIYNILNIRGDVPAAALDMVNPQRKVLRAASVEIPSSKDVA